MGQYADEHNSEDRTFAGCWDFAGCRACGREFPWNSEAACPRCGSAKIEGYDPQIATWPGILALLLDDAEGDRAALEAKNAKMRAVVLALADNLERPDGSPPEDSSEAMALAMEASEVMAVALEEALGLPPQADWNPIGAALRTLVGSAS
jgi:hypothetical protein